MKLGYSWLPGSIAGTWKVVGSCGKIKQRDVFLQSWATLFPQGAVTWKDISINLWQSANSMFKNYIILWHSLNWQYDWWSIQRDGMAGQETIDIYKYIVNILYYTIIIYHLQRIQFQKRSYFQLLLADARPSSSLPCDRSHTAVQIWSGVATVCRACILHPWHRTVTTVVLKNFNTWRNSAGTNFRQSQALPASTDPQLPNV